jgi:glutamyl-tRNA reductase
LTSPSTQLLSNNERLKTYGDALMSVLFITDCYLNRSDLDTERELDTKRKSLNSKDHLSFANLQHGIFNYMLTDPLSHLPSAVKPEDDSYSKLIKLVGIRHNTV